MSGGDAQPEQPAGVVVAPAARPLGLTVALAISILIAAVAITVAIREAQSRAELSREVRILNIQLLGYRDIAEQAEMWQAEHFQAELKRRAAEREAFAAQQAAKRAAEGATTSADHQQSTSDVPADSVQR